MNRNTNSTARATCSMIVWICRRISPTSIASRFGYCCTSADSHEPLAFGRTNGAEIRPGHLLEHAGREQREEVRPEAVPFDLAQARDLGRHRRAREVEGQRVAELEVQRFRNPLLHRQPRVGSFGCTEPLAGGDAVGLRQVTRPRQIELALGEPPRSRVESRRVERLAVDGDEPPANHRIERRVGAGHRLQRRAHAVDLIGQHVDEEVVRRIGRQARAPVAQQVAAHDGEQQERHQAERERADLQARRERPAAQVGEAEAPGHAALRQPLQERDQEPRRERRGDQQSTDAADDDRARLRVVRLPADQRGDDRGAKHVGRETAGARARQVAPQHAQRRHAGERDQRRQREAEQQQDAGAERGDRRRDSRRRQVARGDRRQERGEQLLAREREHDAGCAGTERRAAANCTTNSASVRPRDAPRQRSIAAVSRWRRR